MTKYDGLCEGCAGKQAGWPASFELRLDSHFLFTHRCRGSDLLAVAVDKRDNGIVLSVRLVPANL
jgi:hypothetical protein